MALMAMGFGNAAFAAHYRGGSATNTISASGMATVEMYTAWHTSQMGSASVTVLNPSGISIGSMVLQSTQPYLTGVEQGGQNYTVLRQVFTFNLSGQPAGLYTFRYGTCCWVGSINNMA